MRKRARLLVSGLVQGVFYRASVRYEAEQHGLVGSARNLMDGCVEVIVEGEETSIYRMIEWCRKGPPGARVQSVDIAWQEAKGQNDSFQIQ